MSRDFRSLFRAWKFVLLTALLGGLLTTLISVALPWRYSSTVELLITQTTSSSIDPYTAIKSSERIASNLASLIYTSTFTEKILAAANGFDQRYLVADPVKRRKQWQNMIATTVSPGTGMLAIVVYHPSKEQARILAEAISKVLTSNASDYFGYNVRAEEIDAPIESTWIARPRFLMNAGLGLLGGFFIGLAWVLGRIGLKSRE